MSLHFDKFAFPPLKRGFNSVYYSMFNIFHFIYQQIPKNKTVLKGQNFKELRFHKVKTNLINRLALNNLKKFFCWSKLFIVSLRKEDIYTYMFCLQNICLC